MRVLFRSPRRAGVSSSQPADQEGQGDEEDRDDQHERRDRIDLWGDADADHAEDIDRQRGSAGAGHEVGNDEVVERDDEGQHGARSEEHTSELQSLMRISYAVFCLKKKKHKKTKRT